MIMPLYTIKMELCITHTAFYGVTQECGPAQARTKALVENFLQELIAILVVQTRGGRREQQHC